jgi:apolipoprotein N-acyltransferase
MRAVENRKFLIRSTNDGLTAVIDPAGRIRQMLPPYQQVAAVVKYGLNNEVTPYARFGDWFVWSCLIIGAGLGAVGLRQS